MRILALDTSGASQSVAVLEDERCLHEIFDPRPSSHSETLLPTIQECLRVAQVSLEGLDAFAATAGPGSFTGLRIGLSSVQALSRATGKPAFGISTLLALAFPNLGGKVGVVPCLDARCGEVYAGVYSGTREAPVEKVADRAWPIEVFLQHLAELPGEKLVLGNALEAYRDRFQGLAQLGQGNEAVRASHVGYLAWAIARRGGAQAPLQARYLRASEAENRLGRSSHS